MMEIVNGIPCFNCTDVERAKKNGGEDTNAVSGAKPKSPIAQARADERTRLADSQKLDENRPLASGSRGTAFNILT